MNNEKQTPQAGVNEIILGRLLPTKSNAQLIGAAIAESCRNGEVNSLETITRLRALILSAQNALDEIEKDSLDDVQRYGKVGAAILGAKIEAVEAGVKYNYTGCPKWLELKSKEDAIATERKGREALLKSLSKPMIETDIDTGETIEVLPAVKTSTTTVKVTLGA